VAAPTLVGNIAGGVIGAPVYLALWPFASCEDNVRLSNCNWVSENMGTTVAVPAGAVGFVTGTPFLPLSFLLPEEPVEVYK
jgi:hypothetical protein